MRQAELNRAVARATGESIATVKRLGFRLGPAASHEEEQDPHTIDWDQLQKARWSEAGRSYATLHV